MIRLIHISFILLLVVGAKFLATNQTKPAMSSELQSRSPILPIQSGNWSATDALGRPLPMAFQTGPYRKNKYVGIFYFLWHGEYGKTVYDITKLTNSNPKQPQLGPAGAFHWWGEPEAGYYKASDPWVIRRNLQMLTMAGVDILFFDVTNAATYLPTVNKLCEISLSMRSQGIPTPYICFVTYTKSKETVEELYNQFYKLGRYSDLWFRWQGKPLMLGKQEETTDLTIRNFFTWRFSWAWTNSPNEPHHWQWIDDTPQDYGWDKDSKIPEEIPVAVAGHPTRNIGKSYRGGRQGSLLTSNLTTNTNKGLYFGEQWKRALEVDPAVIFVAGWNEWIAQRFVASKTGETKFLGKDVLSGQSYFGDLYNEEYNRDIEPMKRGYTDTYYYQLVANIRLFKGVDPLEKASYPKTIKLDGQFNEWESVKPVFVDATGDVLHRNYPGSGAQLTYINNTGRNDIIESRVTYDSKQLYLYVKTKNSLSKPTAKSWMLLFINTDRSVKTGWQGYDYLVNQSVKGNETSISHWDGIKFKPSEKGSITYRDNEIELALPLTAIGINKKRISIDFHWADNIQQLNNINEFFINGDSAPDRRFNYQYEGL